MTTSLSLILTSLALACNSALAFVQPRAFATSATSATTTTTTTTISQIAFQSATEATADQYQGSSTSLQLLPDHHHLFSTASSIILSDDAAAVANANSSLQGVRTFFTIAAVLVFGVVGLAYATAAFIVPQAAAQLEIDTKRLRPGLWEEFEAKLEEGETMPTRPDLLQELGKTMQPIIIKEFEDTANAKDYVDKKSTSKNTTTVSSEDQWKD